MRVTWTLAAAILVGATLVVAFSPEQVSASSCVAHPEDPEVQLRAYNLIFEGEVVGHEPYGAPTAHFGQQPLLYEFKVKRVWRGPIVETMFVVAYSNESVDPDKYEPMPISYPLPFLMPGNMSLVYIRGDTIGGCDQVELSFLPQTQETMKELSAIVQPSIPPPGTVMEPVITPIPAPESGGMGVGGCGRSDGVDLAAVGVLAGLWLLWWRPHSTSNGTRWAHALTRLAVGTYTRGILRRWRPQCRRLPIWPVK